MVEAERAHAAWIIAPNIRVFNDRAIVRARHLGVKVTPVAARQAKTDPPTDTGLFARRHPIDRETKICDALFEGVEIGIASDLEGHEIDARRIGLSQDNTVPVEFIIAGKIDTPIIGFLDQIKANAINIMSQRLIHLEHPNLNKSRAQYSRQSHFTASLDEPC